MSSSSFATGPSPFVGQDLFAQAKAALIAQVPQQVQQNPSTGSSGTIGTGGLGTGGLGTGGMLTLTNQPTYGNLTAPNQSAGLFSNTLNQSTNQSGLLGVGMSPFGTPGNTASTFQTGGKRGKH